MKLKRIVFTIQYSYEIMDIHECVHPFFLSYSYLEECMCMFNFFCSIIYTSTAIMHPLLFILEKKTFKNVKKI